MGFLKGKVSCSIQLHVELYGGKDGLVEIWIPNLIVRFRLYNDLKESLKAESYCSLSVWPYLQIDN